MLATALVLPAVARGATTDPAPGVCRTSATLALAAAGVHAEANCTPV